MINKKEGSSMYFLMRGVVKNVTGPCGGNGGEGENAAFSRVCLAGAVRSVCPKHSWSSGVHTSHCVFVFSSPEYVFLGREPGSQGGYS